MNFEAPFLEGNTEFMIGGRLGYRLPNGLGIAGNLDYVGFESEIVTAPPASRLNAEVYWVTGEINYMLGSANRFRPFFGAGLGAAILSFDVEVLDESGNDIPIIEPPREGDVVFPFFAGIYVVDQPKRPSLAFRSEARAHLLNGEGSGNTLHFELSAGVSLFWGRPEPR